MTLNFQVVQNNLQIFIRLFKYILINSLEQLFRFLNRYNTKYVRNDKFLQ